MLQYAVGVISLLIRSADTLRAPVSTRWEWGFKESETNLTALHLFEAWDRDHGASAKSRPGVDFADLTAWPKLISEGWGTGLNSPQAVVVSMPQRADRRKHFAQRFQEVGWDLNAEWAAAVDGAACPTELRWLKGYEDNASWDHDKPGVWGCYLSHLALLRRSHAKCPTCDLVVFEDDAVFVPNFHERWQSFMRALPHDWYILRLGAQSLWEPSYEVTPEYIRASSVSNTWGYVVRADTVDKLATQLAALPVKGSWGVDAVMQLFTAEMKTYVPTVPLVYAVGECSNSSSATPGQGCDADTVEALNARVASLVAKWPQGYVRTYCVGKGTMRPNHHELAKVTPTACAVLSSDTCCPYDTPPVAAM